MIAWKRGFWSSGSSAPERRKSRTSLSTTFAGSVRQRRVFGAGAQRLVLGEQLEVLAEFGIEARNLGQHLVVGLAPGRDVVDRMQVADDAPGAAKGSRPSESAPAKSFQVAGVLHRRSGARPVRGLRSTAIRWPV
jgi:hypothetical protein